MRQGRISATRVAGSGTMVSFFLLSIFGLFLDVLSFGRHMYSFPLLSIKCQHLLDLSKKKLEEADNEIGAEKC
jgi:hypothetical protein